MTDLMLLLIRSEACGTALTEEERTRILQLTGEEALLQALCRLAKKHDMLHVVAEALLQNELIAKDSPYYAKLYREKMLAVFRYEKLQHEYEQICAALSSAQIPYLPLKGAVIRQYYNIPWIRTSCDVDILVHEEDKDRAAECLVRELNYEKGSLGPHDIALHSPGGSHIELHYQLIEEMYVPSVAAVLEAVWEHSAVAEGSRCCMSDEIFYLYHIAHMVKHLKLGGCGLRPFLDLWVLEHRVDFDAARRDRVLSECGLLKFANVARRLADAWFGDAVHSDTSEALSDFILKGGVYGAMENRVSVQHAEKGGVKYVISRIFMPYDTLKFYYPVLLKHKWLLPFMQVRRWFRLVFCGRLKRSVRELRVNQGISKDEAERMQQFLSDIGLD